MPPERARSGKASAFSRQRPHFDQVTLDVFASAVALLACYLPARRAIAIDPMTILRLE